MPRVLPALILFWLGLPLLAAPPAAPAKAEREAAAAIQPPALPPSPPSPPAAPPPAIPANATPIFAPVAPPLPGQLNAAPVAPRPALAPPNRIPDPPKPALTPVPSVPLTKGAGKQVSSTSSTGQFIVHGDDLKLRSAFSGHCEEVSASLRQLLRDKEAWQLPVVVLLKTGDAARTPGPAASTTISQITNGGFHLQVNFNIRGDLRPTDLRAELIRVLLAERILRHQKELASNRERLLPDWVFTGVQEALDYRQRARPSALFAAIFKSGKIYGIEEIIEASASSIEDGLSKTIYQTSCCALVLALLDHPDGGLRLGKFLNSLASDKRSERELLNQWFPGFAATPASLNKWWSQLANLATPTVSEPLNAAETAKQLEEALTIRYRARPSEIPKPRPVMAAIKPTAAEAPAKPLAKAKADEPAMAPGQDQETVDEKKPSIFRRLLSFGRKPRTDSEVIEEASVQAALAEAETSAENSPPEAAPETAAPRGPVFQDHTPLLDRFFTNDKKPAPEPATAEPSQPKSTEAKETPEPPKTEEPAAKEEGKPSRLNPLNWFRGGKKDTPKDKAAPETPKEAPATKKEAPAAWNPSAGDLLWAWSPLVGDLYRDVLQPQWQTAAPRQVEGFLGLKFGKKKEKGAPEAEAETPKAGEAKPKDTKKPEAPAAKPSEPAEIATAPPPTPIKIKPLFGSGKKDTPETAPAEPPPAAKPKSAASAPKPAATATGDALADAAIPIEDYGAVMKRQDRVEILKRNLNALAGLQTRAAVLFRPIVSEYGEILAGLVEGKTKGVDERLRSLRARSAKALEQSKAVRDFLDVYEANESPVFSGLFDDYLKLPDTIEKELPTRTDPLANYLDALDREFSGH
ncbi:MAG: hypothetical protein U0984_13920 [Prosthecobacter sp.]|nr:hypothetical protein [Prosthecobacter sp.]